MYTNLEMFTLAIVLSISSIAYHLFIHEIFCFCIIISLKISNPTVDWFMCLNMLATHTNDTDNSCHTKVIELV